ncbi:zinc finger MYM-type protein 1-like [Zingiber officinale]|uniref:zinc finger MYM-type protein 1-like n=1 Tax=Zingiber officinale TaxID=94328 RepID=UPI001C4AC9C7|nr:zinc finger MYM-type protein 1-like [Zingiber officinale]
MTNWRKAMEVFNTHVGGVASAHNDARTQLEAFKNQRQSVSHLLQAQGREMEVAYRTRLTTTLDVTRFLLKQGLPFRGHDESLNSSNKGNFLELIEWYTQRNDEVAKTMNENAPGNNQIKSPTVQKDLTRACAAEVTNVILNDIKDNIFSLMVDECRDISVKEQMGVVLRYVNKHGCVIERFLAIVHVSDTSAISLKKAIDELFAKHKLSLSRSRGQGYDGASNMRGEYNGLKALILKENSSARYVHCFAHQLQLVVVAVAKSNRIVSDFFQYVTMIVNITGASCKRKDKFRQLEHDRLVECLEKVLENVYDDGTNDDNSGIATSLIDKMENYEFVFVMHLMKSLLGITNELSLAIQQKDQNIVLAVSLIKTMKVRLQKLREEGWENFLDVVNKFCSNHMIPVPNMEENMRTRGRSRRNGQMITNFHHYRVEIFYQVLDMMVQEMSNRFSESSTEVLTCIACLDLKDSFSQFDIGKLLHLAELYPEDFSLTDRAILEDQLETYIQNIRGEFSMIEDLGSLAKKMVETGKNTIFPLVYRLIELALVLPVATASVERVFSAMKIIKTDLRNRMGDEWMNDSLVVYIKKDILLQLKMNKFYSIFNR